MKKSRAPAPEEQFNPGPRPIVTLAILLGAIIVLGMIFAAIRVFVLERPPSVAYEDGEMQVLFCPRDDCEGALVRAIDGAANASCAFYELNLATVKEELAQERAVVLVDEENAKEAAPTPVAAVPSRGLMHHKFCVINDSLVVTGSMNPTTNDAKHNNNNLLLIRSRTLAQRYQRELSELAARTDGSYTKNRPRPVTVNLSGTVIEQRFCPQEDCEAAVVRELGGARQSVVFMTFSFTSDPIGDSMVAASSRGADVRGVFERRQIDEWTEYEPLLDAGLDVRLDGNRRTMHHKVIIIDNSTVITGSYNPTASAQERNDENLLIIRDARIAQAYREEFERVWTEAAAPE